MAAFLAGAILLAACGGDDDGKAPKPSSEAALRIEARAQAEAVLAADKQKAYDAYAKDCREKVSLATFSKTVDTTLGILEQRLRLRPGADIQVVQVDIDSLKDGVGRVRVILATKASPPRRITPESETFDPWVFEEGRWHNATCVEMVLGSGEELRPAPQPVPAATPTPRR